MRVDYLYTGVQCIEERDGSDTVQRQYVWGQYVDELIQYKKLVAPDAGTYYPLSDLLYRSVLLTKSDKTKHEAYDCDAYGNTLVFDQPVDSNWFADDARNIYSGGRGYPLCQFIFTGRRYDPETSNSATQIYFYRARYYHPQLGRFISRDPIDYGDGMNLYEFVRGEPSGNTDPAGREVAKSAPQPTRVKGKVRVDTELIESYVEVEYEYSYTCDRKDWSLTISEPEIIDFTYYSSEGVRDLKKLPWWMLQPFNYEEQVVTEKTKVKAVRCKHGKGVVANIKWPVIWQREAVLGIGFKWPWGLSVRWDYEMAKKTVEINIACCCPTTRPAPQPAVTVFGKKRRGRSSATTQPGARAAETAVRGRPKPPSSAATPPGARPAAALVPGKGKPPSEGPPS